MTQSEKLQLTKITLLKGNYKAYPPHIPVINPIDTYTAGYLTLLITTPCPSQFSEGYSITACKEMLLSNHHRVIFFQFCNIFHKLVSNVDILWSVEEHKVSKYTWDKSKKARDNYVAIEYPDWKFWPLIWVRTSFFVRWGGIYSFVNNHTISVFSDW